VYQKSLLANPIIKIHSQDTIQGGFEIKYPPDNMQYLRKGCSGYIVFQRYYILSGEVFYFEPPCGKYSSP